MLFEICKILNAKTFISHAEFVFLCWIFIHKDWDFNYAKILEATKLRIQIINRNVERETRTHHHSINKNYICGSTSSQSHPACCGLYSLAYLLVIPHFAVEEEDRPPF